MLFELRAVAFFFVRDLKFLRGCDVRARVDATIYVSAYYYIRVLVLLYMCPHSLVILARMCVLVWVRFSIRQHMCGASKQRFSSADVC